MNYANFRPQKDDLYIIFRLSEDNYGLYISIPCILFVSIEPTKTNIQLTRFINFQNQQNILQKLIFRALSSFDNGQGIHQVRVLHFVFQEIKGTFYSFC